MFRSTSSLKQLLYRSLCRSHISASHLYGRLMPVILVALGFTLILLGSVSPVIAQLDCSDPAVTCFDPVPDDQFVWGFCKLMAFIQTSFGALLMTIAGILAVVSAASGNYRTAIAVIFVGSGAFVLESLIDLFFEQSCYIQIGEPPLDDGVPPGEIIVDPGNDGDGGVIADPGSDNPDVTDPSLDDVL